MQKYIKTILENLTDIDPLDASITKEVVDLVNNPKNSYEIINRLNTKIQLIEDIRGDRKLFYYLYLSIAYLIQEDFELAKEPLENALEGFQIHGFILNGALGKWLFSIVYTKTGNNEHAQWAIENAIQITKQLITQYEEENTYQKYEKAKVYKNYLEEMKRYYEEIKRPTRGLSSLFRGKLREGNSPERMSPDRTRLRKSQQKYLESQDQKKPFHDETSENSSRKSLDNNASPIVGHIIIPVDMRALDDKNPQITLLKSDLFQKLKHYGEHIFPNNNQNETQLTSEENAYYKKHIVIPSFPVYSPAVVNAKGEPNLDSKGLINAKEIYDDLRVRFEGHEYEVKFISNEQMTFANEKRYGWLRVIGESMNKSSPVAINNGDYILFCENHDLASCSMKIVVVGLPEIDSQAPQLVIRRLLRLNARLQSKTKNLRTKYSKFMLRSESSLKKDSQTGISHKKDREINNNYQIMGEVIAIAKAV